VCVWEVRTGNKTCLVLQQSLAHGHDDEDHTALAEGEGWGVLVKIDRKAAQVRTTDVCKPGHDTGSLKSVGKGETR
jgi:hypothetical protein